MAQSNSMGHGTVAGNARDGAEEAHGKAMKTGTKPSTMQGVRSTYLAASKSAPTVGGVSAGTLGAGTGAGKNTVGVMSTAAAPKGRDAAKTLSASAKPMKEGKGPGAKTGLRAGYL